MTQKTAKLSIDGQETIDLPIYTPTLGNDVIDITQLGSHGVFTFDQGFYQLPPVNQKSPILMGIKAFCCIGVIL